MMVAVSIPYPLILKTLHCVSYLVGFFFFGSDLARLAKPSYQTVLEGALPIRAVQCYDCLTAHCGSGHDT